LQGLQDPTEINGNYLNNIGRGFGRHLRLKKRDYLKVNINKLATEKNKKNITDLYKGIY
jgi:hypothetical protein